MAHASCPFCDYSVNGKAPGTIIRTDNLRRHLTLKHADGAQVSEAFIDGGGYQMRKLSATIYIRHKADKMEDGFCLSCMTWILMGDTRQTNRETLCLAHECKEKQTRVRKIGSAVVVPKEQTRSDILVDFLKKAGLNIEFSDDMQFDEEATIKAMRIPKPPVPVPAAAGADCILDRVKRDKSLKKLKISDYIEHIMEENEDCFDAVDDIVLPLMAQGLGVESMAAEITQLRLQLSVLTEQQEDASEFAKRESFSNTAELIERNRLMAIEVTEARSRLHTTEMELDALKKINGF